MKLDLDCVRDILLSIEKRSYGETVLPNSLSEELKYDSEVINYALLKLCEADFIDAHVLELDGVFPSVTQIYDITFAGHEFLNNVRANKIWSKTKSVLSEIGSGSLQLASQIAVGVLTEIIKQYTLTP